MEISVAGEDGEVNGVMAGTWGALTGCIASVYFFLSPTMCWQLCRLFRCHSSRLGKPWALGNISISVETEPVRGAEF